MCCSSEITLSLSFIGKSIAVRYVFPNIKFINDRKDGFDHLVQTLMDGVVLAVILYFFSKAGSWLLGVLTHLVNSN